MPLLHPVSGAPLTPLEREIWRFRMVAHETQVMLRGFNRTGDVAKVINTDLLFALCNHGLLLVCKFLEVWDDFGSLSKTEPRVIEARRAVQPILDRIGVWRDLDRFRNTTLAHPYLTKDGAGELIGPWELLATEKAPSYHAEIILLITMIQYAVLGILAIFEAEYVPLRPILVSPLPHPGPGPGISLGADIKPSLRPILVDVDTRLAKLGVVVKGDLSREFFEAVEKL